jgi:biopolymer transport protein ExbB
MNMLLSTYMLAQGAQPGAPPLAGGFVSTAWEMTIRGGWIMVPLAICSLVAMTIVVERLILTRRGRIVPRALLEALTSLRHNPRDAHARCAADPSPLAAVVLAGIKSREQPRAAQERAMGEAGERELRKLRQRMRLLSCLPQTATMLGLLGTVFGMIRTFTVVAASGESLGKTERLAQGIYEAWTATAAGLVVAVPTLIAFHMVMARIDAAAAALDSAANLWLDADDAEPAAAGPAPVASLAPSPVVVVTAKSDASTNGQLAAAAAAS